MKKLTVPFDRRDILDLRAGDRVLLSGVIYTGRDAAHKRLDLLISSGERLPIDIVGATIYYVGPCVMGDRITSAGPTTSSRMDKYAPRFYDKGVLATIGKGDRSDEVYASIAKNKCVYFAAIGGAGATYANCIKSFEVAAYADLGTEAIYKLTVEDMPLIVAIDSFGGSIYRR